MKTYYHTTNQPLKGGEIMSINDYDGDFNKGHLNLCPQKQEINLLLDSQRPQGVLLRRTKAIYLFDNLSICKEFAKQEGRRYVYEVIPIEPVYGPFPMAIVHRLYKGAEECKELIKEYWRPTRGWNVYEYLTSKIKIVKDCSKDSILASLNEYDKDYKLAKSLCYKERLRKDGNGSWPGMSRHDYLLKNKKTCDEQHFM